MVKKIFNPKKYYHKRIVIDTSVLVKAFLQEEGYECVYELIKMSLRKELTFLATPLILFEVLNVLSRTIADPNMVQNLYEKFNKLSIGIVDLENKSINFAISQSCASKNISYYDASYHALAKQFDAIFLTADKEYLKYSKDMKNVELFEV